MWIAEAAVLFFIGRKEKVLFYEKMLYPTLAISFVSLLVDWNEAYYIHAYEMPSLFNSMMLTSIFYLAILAVIIITCKKYEMPSAWKYCMTMLAILACFVLYMTFALEINYYWMSKNSLQYTYIWEINYSLVFFSVMAFVNQRLIRWNYWKPVIILLLSVSAFAFLTISLSSLDELRMSWIAAGDAGFSNSWVRYVSWLILILADVLLYLYRDERTKPQFFLAFCAILYLLFAIEIYYYWISQGSAALRCVWEVNYALVFFSVMSVVNRKWVPSKMVKQVVMTMMIIFAVSFLLGSLYNLNILRQECLADAECCYQPWIRYFSWVLFIVADVLFFGYRDEKTKSYYFFGCSMALYLMFAIEMGIYWTNQESVLYNVIWEVNLALGTLSIIAFVHRKWFYSDDLRNLISILLGNVISFFLFASLYALSELRMEYLSNENSDIWLILIRYVSLIFLVLGTVLFYMYRTEKTKSFFLSFVLFVAIWYFSSELLNIFSLCGVENAYKLALSIFWGICSLALIYCGLFHRMKYMIIEGICLFGVTLLKVFFLDISHLNSLSKTIVFIALGVLLLISSFLYNMIAKRQELEGAHEQEEEEETESNA